jgi:membrane-bound lytic murein transglycosylase A
MLSVATGLNNARAQKPSQPMHKATQPLAPKYLTVGFDQLPGWAADDHAAAFKAYVKSCAIVIASNKGGSAVDTKSVRSALLGVCAQAVTLAEKRITDAAARAFFETHFAPHRLDYPGAPGLMTGYYEPIIQGSRTPSPKFAAPVYRRPSDLINIVDESMRGAKSASLTHARKTSQGTRAYATRAEIEQGALKGQGLELMYLANPVDVFFMQIQGSGRIKLPNGSMVRLSYDGKNGHPYTSIGRYLIDSGELSADKMSLDALAQWLSADVERGRRVMWQNKSFVFFRELKGAEAGGALGVLNIPLTPGRSLAVDAGVHPIGLPIYVVSSTLMHAQPSGGFNRLMVAQDVGSAIKGVERGDIYFGSGPAAAKLAGVTKHAGNFYVLLPRGADPVAAKSEPNNSADRPPLALDTMPFPQATDP